ncbi:hypothetical protein VNI00_010726 [Paramarasmius palmivorus]|uniref:Uncharacterized protein n=1 Tax=Paramarasmius palmivorus TaxID=297713 RepID=A0AAW0CH57_9AGAR
MSTYEWRPQGQFRRFLPPTSISPEAIQAPSMSMASSSSSEKRKRSSTLDSDLASVGAGPSRVVAGEGDSRQKKTKKATTAKTPNLYESNAALLNALRNAFKEGDDVVFAGSFLVSNDPPIADKQRVQTVTNDIWQATGYRFTFIIRVKDHPRTKEGHKTRLWCSQDEMRKHKPHAKARVSASGESLAKARYPCRSRLFISSREWNAFGQSLVTIRMHHHFSHEPYDCASRAPVSTSINPLWVNSAQAWPEASPGAPSYHPGLMSHHQQSFDSYDGSSNHSSITAVDNGSMEWEDVSDDEGPSANMNGAADSDSEPDEIPVTHATTSPPLTHPYTSPTSVDTNTPTTSHTPSIAEPQPISGDLNSFTTSLEPRSSKHA